MASASTWIVLVGLGWFVLYLMKYTGAFLDAIFVRLAAFLFLAAGTVGATGWLGDLLNSAFTTTNSAGNEIARSAVGSGFMWFVWFALGVLWLLCILPEKWFSRPIPDWLSIAGLVIPAGVATVPGPAGNFLLDAVNFFAGLVTGPATALFGG
jgi:hypothetical protein